MTLSVHTGFDYVMTGMLT